MRAKVNIHDIQCAVEEALMSGRWLQLARTYIEYRHDRDLTREQRGKLHHAIRGLVEQTNAAKFTITISTTHRSPDVQLHADRSAQHADQRLQMGNAEIEPPKSIATGVTA